MQKLFTKTRLSLFMRNIAALSLVFCLTALPVLASSHSEAPMITMDRFADNTDVYAFRSTEAGRSGFVTILSNFIPLQDPSGGPQFFRFDDSVLYEIKIDNTGDGIEDITYQFRFTTQIVNPRTVLGMSTANQNGIIESLTDVDYNMPQTYSVTRIDRSSGRGGRILAAGLRMPPSNIGPLVTPNYEANLALPAIYPLGSGGGRVFAGQRDESFFLDLGVFDLINYRVIGPSGGVDSLRSFNINTIAIEVPIENLTRTRTAPTSPTAPESVIGIWSTASRRSTRVLLGAAGLGAQSTSGDFVQVSRLGSPLINEVVVPLGLKDAFNAIPPTADAVAAPAVLNPEFPRIIQLALSAYKGININIPPAPRNDIAAIFVTGIPAGAVPGLPNYTTFLSDGQPHEFLRLNVAIPVTPAASASRLGLLGNDIGGFPNGRRVFDDVVDIEVRALLGGTPFTPPTNVPPNNAFGDGVSTNEQPYLTRFPYLAPPNQGNTPRPANAPSQLIEGAKGGDLTNPMPFQVDAKGNLK